MDGNDSPLEVADTFIQDSAHLQVCVDFKKENREGGIFIPGSFDRENMDELDSMVAMMVADIVSTDDASSPNAEAPNCNEYSTDSGWIYNAFKPVEGVQIGSSKQSDPSFNLSSSDSSQLDPVFVHCHEMSGEGNQHYAPESIVAVNASTGDVPACQIFSPTTSLPKSVMKASSSSSQKSSQKLGENTSRKKELRLIKNRQAAKESRRRKKEYIKYLEACISTLQLQNKKIMEEINYISRISRDNQQ